MYSRVQCITTAIVTTWYTKYSFDVMLIIILGEIRNWQFSALQNQIHSTQHNHSYKNNKKFVLKESTTMVELTYGICIIRNITHINIIMQVCANYLLILIMMEQDLLKSSGALNLNSNRSCTTYFKGGGRGLFNKISPKVRCWVMKLIRIILSLNCSVLSQAWNWRHVVFI